ncbi:MAG: UDP-4-amino-4,6-dideoxy-N-acetyl-beta-L-altrosamine transaminase [Acidimicrobiia bacterium]|nr:UDP-4-amino-4,6-dideoxy-N-acetyl-beta-L-altrosamine transaminase [Acidimicrobiia bacterium]
MSTLALHGGAPVRSALLPYGRQMIDDTDVSAVVAALTSDFLTTGPAVERFERAFASFVGAKHAVAVSNGTAALHVAAAAAGVRAGDRVVTTPLTFVASANCARYQGATPVFADVHRDTLTIDPAQVDDACRAGARAIVTVDYAGLPSDLDDLLAICQARGAVLIEDAAHAVGATYRGRTVGSVAHLTTFSLHPVKQMTTGEGGVITTNDDAMATAMRRFRNHGITLTAAEREKRHAWAYDVEDLGYNYRLTDVQCALGLSQMAKLPGYLARRRDIAAAFDAALADLPTLERPARCADRDSSWHLYVVRLNLDRLTTGRAEIFAALRAENIGVNVHYVPVPWHSTFAGTPGAGRGHWPIAEAEYERLLTLPLWPGMSDADVADVVTAVRKVLGAFTK